MPFNGSGTFSVLTPPSPFVTGTTISAPDMNSVFTDIATNGLTNAVTRDGQSPLTANWPVGGFNITGIGTLSATTGTFSGTVTIGTLSVTTVSPTTLTVSGNGTVGGTLGVTGAITGSSTIKGTGITASTGLTVSAGGATITGDSTITGTLGGLTGLTMASGALTVSATGIVFSDASTLTTAPTSYNPSGSATTPFRVRLPINSGASNIQIVAGSATTNGSGEVTVTFPVTFTTAPKVMACVISNTSNIWASAQTPTTTTTKFQTTNSGGSSEPSILINWWAIGPTA